MRFLSIMSTKLISILTLAILATIGVSAQNSQTVEVDFEKKIIYADSLNLPKSINVGALLRLLPELLQRPGESVLANYEVQIEDVSMGESADAVLTVLQLADIEKIEVKNSPLSTDLNNGQSGAINFCLRPLAKKRLGLSGTASLSVSSEVSVMPNLLLDYHGKKFSVRAMAFGEGYDYENHYTETRPSARFEQQYHERYGEQTMRAQLNYQPDERNMLQLTLTEGTSRTKMTTDHEQVLPLPANTQTVDERIRSLKLMSHLKYVHAFKHDRGLEAQAQFLHSPQDSRYSCYPDIFVNNTDLWTNNWQTSLEFFDQLKLAQGKGSLKYKLGAKAAQSHQDVRIERSERELVIGDSLGVSASISHLGSTSENEVLNVMPFAELTLLYGPLRMKLGAEYQWSDDRENRDWTGRMVVGWQIDRRNRLRLLLNRQFQRPLLVSQEAGIDYFADFAWGKHKLTTNVGVNYCMTNGEYYDMTHHTSLNLMAIYQYDYFFLSVTGNQYFKETDHEKPVHGHYAYYNLSVMPSFNFSNGWRTAMNLRYYSSIQGQDLEENACCTLQFNVGKSWGNWNAYLYGRTPLTGKAETRYVETESVITYDLVQSSFGGGVSLRF